MKRQNFAKGDVSKKSVFFPAISEDENIANTITIKVGKAEIRMCGSGNIYVNGRLCENDQAVVQGMRDIIGGTRVPF